MTLWTNKFLTESKKRSSRIEIARTAIESSYQEEGLLADCDTEPAFNLRSRPTWSDVEFIFQVAACSTSSPSR